MTLDEALAEIEKLKGENAKQATGFKSRLSDVQSKLKAAETARDEALEQVEAVQQGEQSELAKVQKQLEKLTGDFESTQSELEKERDVNLRRTALVQAGFSADKAEAFVNRLQGSDAETYAADAKALAEMLPPSTPGVPPVPPPSPPLEVDMTDPKAIRENSDALLGATG